MYCVVIPWNPYRIIRIRRKKANKIKKGIDKNDNVRRAWQDIGPSLYPVVLFRNKCHALRTYLSVFVI